MDFSVSAAAKLYGKQRKTLYRHMESGRLSYRVQGDGHRVIDLSELIRVYGEPSSPIARSDTEPTHPDSPSDTPVWHAMLDELRALRKEVADLKQQLLRLPAPQPMDSLPEEATQDVKREEITEKAKKNDDDPHGFRELVQSIRENSQ